MNSEQPAHEPGKKIWTGGRVALAALVFSLLTVALSSSCNPTDSSNVGHTANSAAAPAGSPQQQPAGAQTRPARPAVPEDLTDEQRNIRLTTLEGRALGLPDLAGKVVILNVWATWCGPCRREIPDFIKIQNDYQGRGVEVLGVTMEDERNPAEAVREFAKQFEINYKVVWTDEAGWRALLLPTGNIPQTYVLGQDGKLLKRFVGYSPQVAVMARSLIDEALNKK